MPPKSSGLTAQFGMRIRRELLAQDNIEKRRNTGCISSFSNGNTGKKSGEDRRRNCAVLPQTIIKRRNCSSSRKGLLSVHCRRQVLFAVCRFPSLPFRRRSRLFYVHAQRGGRRVTGARPVRSVLYPCRSPLLSCVCAVSGSISMRIIRRARGHLKHYSQIHRLFPPFPA